MRSLEEIKKINAVGSKFGYGHGSIPLSGSQSSQTYTSPRFEDTTRSSATRKSDKAFEEVLELRKSLSNALQLAGHWESLHDELHEKGVDKVSQLPADRIAYWKSILDYPLRSV